MGLDLGTLSIHIKVDDAGAAQTLDNLERRAKNLKQSIGQVENSKVNIDADTTKVDKAKSSTTKLGEELDTVGRKRVSPDVDTRQIRAASDDIKNLGSNLGGLADKAVKWSAGAAAVAGVGTIGTALTKGFSRLDAIDQATAKLEALGNGGVAVQEVMDNALASVKGTSFGIGDAASTAAVLVGAGVKPGEELESTLKLVADSAAIAGVSFNEMGSIWGKVASNTVLSGEEMAQISDRSIGLQVALADKYGVTAQEAKKMVSEGKVSFEDFSDAMENLVGGGAVRMGETVSGAMDNFGAALGRGGAAILESGFQALPDVLGAATSAVDDVTAHITPLAAEWGASLAPHLESFANDLGPNVAAGMSMISDGAGTLAPLIGKIGDGLGAIPWPVAAGGIAALIGHNKGLTDSLEKGTGRGKEYVGMLTDGIGGAFARSGGAFDKGSSRLGIVAQAHRVAADAARVQAMDSKDAFNTMDRMGAQAAHSLVASTSQIGAGFSGMARGGMSLAKSAMDGVTGAAKGVMGAFGGPWGLAIMGATTLLGYLADEHFKVKKAEEEHKAMQDSLRESFDETTGAITAQTQALVDGELNEHRDTIRDLGLAQSVASEAALGNEDAQKRVNSAIEASNTSAVKGTGFWEKYGDAAGNAGVSVEDFGKAVSGDTGAGQEVSQFLDTIAGSRTDFIGMKNDIGDVTGANEELAAQVGLTSEAFELADEAFRSDQLKEIEEQASRTEGALRALGDTAFKLEDADTISISVDDAGNIDELREKMAEFGVEVSEPFEGRVSLDFPDGLNILSTLQEIGVHVGDYKGYVTIENNSPEVQEQLGLLGLTTMDFEGNVVINSNDPDVKQRMIDLGILVETDKNGEVRISDNIQAVLNRGKELDARNGRVTIEERRVLERTIRSTEYANTAGGTAPLPMSMQSDGSVLQFFANGGTRENHVAQIAKPGDWRVWAEPETGGEAYIPLAPSKRGRSMTILEEVAHRFQMALVDKNAIAFADGGISDKVKGELGHLDGTPYVFGGWSPAGTDCSGAVSLVANVATGRDPWEARTSTHTMDTFLADRGFVEGQGGPGTIRVGWKNGGPGGGHTALTLDDGTNIESGGNTGGGFTIGGKAASGNDPQFTDFMHLPLADQGGWSDMSSGSNSGMGSYRTSSSGGGASLTKSVNGGAGALFEDGSLLELAAALHSAHTGQPMADDVVSWGNVLGLGTTFEGEDLPRQQRDLVRQQGALERDHAATLRDIEQAKADLKKQQDELAAGGKETGSGDNKKFTAFTTEETAERERKIADQQDKVLDLEDRLLDLQDSQTDLIKSQDELRGAIERATAASTSFGGTITPMANGGILGSLSRNAQISDGSSAVLWAEDGPEAYIPLSSDKRAQSLDIWAESGKQMGIDVMGMLNLLGAGASGLVRGDLGGFNTGSSFSLAGAGLNTQAASHMGQSAVSNAVGAQFYGPVSINDPQQWAQSQLDVAQKKIHSAMKGMRNG